jgi:hypothetical protein
MPASNTKDCFREFIGQKLVGVLFDGLPLSRHDLASGSKTLVFEDGRGLTIASNGTYGIDSAEDVRAAVRRTERALSSTMDDLAGALRLAEATNA